MALRFEAAMPKDYKPVYNAAQSQKLPVITSQNNYKAVKYQWGIIPFDSSDKTIGDKLLNARAQTLKAKQPFCDLLESKRCIILADSFYIWKEKNNVKIPYRVMLKSEEPFAIAGVWNEWQMESNADNEEGFFGTFAMVTCPASSLTESINDRMPAILARETEQLWISEEANQQDYIDLLKPYPADEMKHYKVASLVNSETINTRRVIDDIGSTRPGETLSLFD